LPQAWPGQASLECHSVGLSKLLLSDQGRGRACKTNVECAASLAECRPVRLWKLTLSAGLATWSCNSARALVLAHRAQADWIWTKAIMTLVWHRALELEA